MASLFDKLRLGALKKSVESTGGVGIDIGTSSVKVLQLHENGAGKRAELETYGELTSYGHIRRFNDAIHADGFRFFEGHVIRILDTLLEQTDVSSRDVVFSIPVFATFVTMVTLPWMEEAELATAVPLQARQYIPTPLEDVELTWMVAGEQHKELNTADVRQNTPERRLRVLLVAAPKDVIQQYLNVADTLNLSVQAIELESIALARSSAPRTESAAFIDIGGRSTDVSVVENGAVQFSHNVNIAGVELTKALVHTGLAFKEAETKKRTLSFADKQGTPREEFREVADQLGHTLKKIIDGYVQRSGRPVESLVLAGGSSHFGGMVPFVKNIFPESSVSVADPWRDIAAPDELRSVLVDIGPSYAVATGLALRWFEAPKTVELHEETVSTPPSAITPTPTSVSRG